MMLFIGFNACKNKDVAPIPKAEFTYNINSNGNISFNSVSTNAITFLWQLDNTQRNSKSFDYTFPRNGNYSVSLTAKDNSGNSDVIVKDIKIDNLRGTLMIYRSFSSGQNLISVYVDGNYVDNISGLYYYTSAPECGNGYCSTKTNLTEGVHTYRAVESSTNATWNGSMEIKGGSCSRVGLTK